jgi:phosphohistidine phosphatase
MKLYIARHGNAVTHAEDASRPLSTTGVAEVDRMAAFLADAGVRLYRVLHSGKTRARQTAGIYARVLGQSLDIEEIAGLKPEDNPAAIARLVHDLTSDTLIAGHLPHLDRLCALLISGNAELPIVSLPTGAVVCLERDDYRDGWRLAWLVEPALLG